MQIDRVYLEWIKILFFFFKLMKISLVEFRELSMFKMVS